MWIYFWLELVAASTLKVDDQLTRQQCIAKNGAIKTANALTIKKADDIFENCKMEKKQKFLMEHCAEITDSYVPLGLIDEIDFIDALNVKGICNVPKPTEEIPNVSIDPNLATVMMVGESGEGKSYLGNALYGETNADSGPFSVGHKVGSHTKFVKNVESTYFGGRGATFDIPSFELNVLDTPGFGDSDPLKRKANAHRIALAFDFGVNSIILVIGKAELKLKDPVQRMLTQLHDWTNGQVWKHLTILLRDDFTDTNLIDRAEANKSHWTLHQDGGKQFLLHYAKQNNWKMNGGTRFLEKGDLDVLILPFNASQNKYCLTKKQKRRKMCRKMPVWEWEAPDDETHWDDSDDEDDYHRIVDEDGSEYEPTWMSDNSPEMRYFFIEGAKLLADRIQVPNKIQFHTVIAEYRKKIKELNQKYQKIDNTMYGDDDQSALPDCQKKSNTEKAKIDILLSCPSWDVWRNSGTCSKKICGHGKQMQKRTCVNQGIQKSLNLCKTTSERSSRYLDCNTSECPAWGSYSSYSSCSPSKNCRIDGQGSCPSRTRTRVIDWKGLENSGYIVSGDSTDIDINGCNCEACNKVWGSWGGQYCDGCHRRRSRTCYDQDYDGKRLGSTTINCLGGFETTDSWWSRRCGWGCAHKMSDGIWNG